MNSNSLEPVFSWQGGAWERRERLKAAGLSPLPRPAISRGFNDKSPVIVFDSSCVALRYVRRLEVAGRQCNTWNHHGWYTDEDLSETIKPAVALMGKVHLYGYKETGGMLCFYLDGPRQQGDTFDDCRRDAARWADSEAERAAENEREYNARWREARRLEDKRDELTTERASIYETARAWVADFRGSLPSPALYTRLCAMLRTARHKAAGMATEITSLNSEIATLPE